MENMVKQTLKETFEEIAVALETGSFGKKTRVGLTILGSEHGPEELLRGAELAQSQNADLEVVVIGTGVTTDLELVEAADDEEAHKLMDEMLLDGRLDSAVTLHYNFPIGVSTVGRVITPAMGKELLIGTTTGTADTNRVAAMIKNAIFSVATAKACGNADPTVGILNIEGARQVEKALNKLKDAGYPITFTESARADGGVVMRGNDLLQGVPDIMVMDSLTGNVMMKMFSAYSTGGSYEASGFGYGPGVGEGYDRIIGIISRASGAPVIAGAIRYMGSCAQGQLLKKVKVEFTAAKKAGLDKLLADLTVSKKAEPATEEVACPPEKTCTADIPGIEILDLEDAVHELWKAGIYASSGMGCTGPIVMMAEEDLEKSRVILKEKDYI
jgi:hypothetical protein